MDARQQWAEILAAASEPVERREAALRTAVRLGLAVAPAAVGCSLTEQVGSGYRTVASANELALALDRAQYAADDGPCLVAASTGAVERVDRIDPDTGYRAFAAAARDLGVASSISIPLTGVDRPAALNFYAAAPGGFADTRPALTAEFLGRAVAALRRGGPAPAQVSAAELTRARSRRQLIERAGAVLAGEGGEEAAFAVLVARGRDEQRSIFDVAADIIGTDTDTGTEVAS